MALFETNQVGKREDLSNLLTRVDERATPYYSMVKKGSTPRNTFLEWVVDDYDAPETGGVVDGTDVTEYENHAENRAVLSTYLQTKRRTAQVTPLAQDVSVVAGISNETAEAIAKKGVELIRDIERICLGDQEHQIDNGSIPYLTRGLGTWILNTTNIAAQTLNPVPENYRPGNGQIDTTSVGSITESDIQDILQAIFDTTGMQGDYKLFAGSVLRRAFTDFTRTIPTAGYAGRDFNFDGNSKKVTNSTTIFEGDFGQIEVVADNFIGSNAAGTTLDTSRGYMLDMDKMELCVHKQPTIKHFEDRGGGDRFMIETRFANKCRNPIGLAQFNTNLS